MNMKSLLIAASLALIIFVSPKPAVAQNECGPGEECEVCEALDNNWHRMTCGTVFLAWTGSFHPYKALASCNAHGHWETRICEYYSSMSDEKMEEFFEDFLQLDTFTPRDLVAFATEYTGALRLDTNQRLLQVRGCQEGTVVAQVELSQSQLDAIRRSHLSALLE